ncbi:dTDP-4-dehydrorhamnose reductase [Flavobacterium cellulosilyticum]|uniref:dTDP-4-dehydrorhamnose reductase n=1 Tax=Flavobacterium cellulosilyticum TaxID=2541731 RepID=A0A4R5CEB0_9FLAO|nr:dTDP-4-dehydrorhamnose reductase [Flavobacterium cellulosilyticum]TDD98391.1 dTDP-4-dehydrorhamnose reductase [Flavobacterium cellulosilyticum]
MKKVLVTGANGQLGSEIKELAVHYSKFDFIFTDIADFPLDKEAEIVANFNQIQPDIVINCAAYTAVDKAEQDQETANAINHLAIKTLAQLCKETNAKLIHISTDYVFDGTSAIAYKEEDIPNPKSVYGVTKLAGEIACQRECPDGIIIRTAWVYSEFGNNFVKTMLRLMTERETLSVVNDQVGSPTYAADLAQVILTILDNEKWEPGTYHYSNHGEISWFDFANDIKEIANKSCEIIGIPASNYPTPAERPAYSLLNKAKIKAVYDIDPVDYKISLKKMMARL